MYNLINLVAGPVLYFVLLIGSSVVLSRPRRERRHHLFLALQTGVTVVALLMALTLAVGGDRAPAAVWAVAAVICAATAAGVHRRYRRYQREAPMSPTPRPVEYEHFLRRFAANDSTTWGGPGDRTPSRHLPCPFCAAADFVVYPSGLGASRAADAVLTAPHVCDGCGRGGRFRITAADPTAGRWWYEFAQTIGDPPPAWLRGVQCCLNLVDLEQRLTTSES